MKYLISHRGTILTGLGLIVFLARWQYAGSTNSVVHLFVSDPLSIWAYLTANYELLAYATGYTIGAGLIGLFLGILCALGVLFVGMPFPQLLKSMHTMMIMIQVIPFLSLAPLIIVVFGIGIGSKIVIALLSCFFPMFVACLAGVQSISTDIKNLAKLYHLTAVQKIFHIYMPLMLPQFFAGLKVNITLAIIGAMVGEYNGAEYGLGKNLFLSAKTLDADLMMSSIFLVIVVTFICYGVIVLAERRWGRWYSTDAR